MFMFSYLKGVFWNLERLESPSVKCHNKDSFTFFFVKNKLFQLVNAVTVIVYVNTKTFPAPLTLNWKEWTAQFRQRMPRFVKPAFVRQLTMTENWKADSKPPVSVLNTSLPPGNLYRVGASPLFYLLLFLFQQQWNYSIGLLAFLSGRVILFSLLPLVTKMAFSTLGPPWRVCH